jgi:hypothetical protein
MSNKIIQLIIDLKLNFYKLNRKLLELRFIKIITI